MTEAIRRNVDGLPTVDIIGVPIELGAGRRGAQLGPDVVRASGLQRHIEELKYTVRDNGNVEVPDATPDAPGGPGRPRHLELIRRTCEATADAVAGSMRAGGFPVVVGGDHSIAIGVLAGIARVNGPAGVIWIDAHADLNTPETSPTGNVHGMPMAAALGYLTQYFSPPTFPAPAADAPRCVFVGLRDLDPAERRVLRSGQFAVFTMSDIDRLGISKVMERAIQIASTGPASVHVSVDIDSLDPLTAPGTGTPVPGGLTYREAHLAMEMVYESGVAHSLEVAEVNPILDEGTATARVAMELICSALGKSIL